MTIDRQEIERKAQALLKFALGNHNAKRYGEAAGFYDVILQRYPDTEAAQYAGKNLQGLVNKVEGVEPIVPDEALIHRVEEQQVAAPEPKPAAVEPTPPKPKPAAVVEVAPTPEPAPTPVSEDPKMIERKARERELEIEKTARQRQFEAVLEDTRLAQPVVVVDIRMRFWSMVWFMVKWAFATIPAMIIIIVITWLLVAFFGGFFKGLSGH